MLMESNFIEKYAERTYATQRNITPLNSRWIVILLTRASEKLPVATVSSPKEKDRKDCGNINWSELNNILRMKGAKQTSIKLCSVHRTRAYVFLAGQANSLTRASDVRKSNSESRTTPYVLYFGGQLSR